MKSKSFFAILLFMFFLICSPTVMGQGGPGDPGPDPDQVNPPSAEIPFDGGIGLLIAAGIGYAAKKGYDKRKKDKAANGLEK